MADPTKVVRFPNRKRLHLVWSSPSLGDADAKAQKPENTYSQPSDTTISTPRKLNDSPTTPAKTD